MCGYAYRLPSLVAASLMTLSMTVACGSGGAPPAAVGAGARSGDGGGDGGGGGGGGVNDAGGSCDELQPSPATGDLAFDFEGLAPWPGGIQGVDENAVALSGEQARLGASSVRMTVSQGDVVALGTRAEITWDNGDLAGAEVFYAWSLYLPVDWPDVTPMTDAVGRPNWQIVAQWHDQPNFACGETWDGFPANSPPIAVQYFYPSSSDPQVLEVLANNRGTVVGLDASVLDQPLLGFTAGTPPELRAVAPIVKGQWIDLQVRILWSQGNDGEAELTIDGAPLAQFDGPNMWNKVSHYFKTGLYRNPDIVPDQTLYIDEILATRSAATAAAHDAMLATSR